MPSDLPEVSMNISAMTLHSIAIADPPLRSSYGLHVATSGDRSQTYLVPGENPADQHARTFAAIEFACLDIIGKALGKPVCDVIGGRVRDEVSFSAYLFYKHAGGGGLGEDRREDEYGEVLDPKAAVRE